LSGCKYSLNAAGFETSLEEDEALIKQHQMENGAQIRNSEMEPIDERSLSAVLYRVERKRLLKVCYSILSMYVAKS
jgi:hypothetical protein